MGPRRPALLLGLAAFLAACARVLGVVLPLNGDWRVYNRNKSYQFSGVVPGNVYTDLMRAKLIDNAYYRDNDERFAWVGHDNWTYTRDFQLKEEHTQHRRILLVAHGIDTVATVYVNDVPVGDTDNMFVRYVFDIKQHIKVGYNNVSVEFTSAVAHAREHARMFSKGHQVPPECPPLRQRGECSVNQVRKAQASFSWEMAPAFPTQGIWKDIGIEMYDGLVIRDMVVRTRRLGSQNKGERPGRWSLDVGLFLEVAFSGKTRLLLSLVLDERLTVKKNISVSANSQLGAHYRFRLRIPETLAIEPWWPNGYGEHRLYTLSISLSLGSDTAIITRSIGFRTVDLIQEPLVNSTGATFFLRVNGLPLFAKGSAWLPADAFPDRVTSERLEALLDSAAAAHMNLLRVWGGGLYESDVFYDMADRKGLMIWQDFAFASALYPATPAFLDSVALEARQQLQVRRLSHHASLVLWCGNSENELGLAYNWWKLLTTEHREDYVKLYVETLQKIVYEEDMSRPFVGSTPSNGLLSELSGGIHDNPNDVLYGDVHYFDYYSPPWSLDSVPTPRFCSSFGLVSFPSMETLATALEPGDLVLPFPQTLENRMHLANARLETYMSAVVTLPKKDGTDQALRILILLSQIYQAMGVKTQAEHYRRQRLAVRRSQGLTMGAVYWHLNDVWQAPSWSSIDYTGEWKMLHYFAKRFYAPLLVSPYEEAGRLVVYVLDDLYHDEPYDLLLEVKLYHYASLEPKTSIARNFTVRTLCEQLQF
ncbi:beta-mannosidase-like [Dermacentor variabilis]|uniref:beta-mannosidase-like n=1 Tax=Dermacentor variabilis TaxID=34621 RepID=UPI003F5BCFCA